MEIKLYIVVFPAIYFKCILLSPALYFVIGNEIAAKL